ncbi:MAG: CNNM domain-containing protein [Comamonadaceae bacterium]|nr:CNNM domain-containing protein [Comamonadaceae bacterium]
MLSLFRRSSRPGQAPEHAMEILILLALILLNGLFAMSEMAVVSSRKIRLQQMAQVGGAGARAAPRPGGEPEPFPVHRPGRHHHNRHLQRCLRRGLAGVEADAAAGDRSWRR